jgi:hypothetical protein
MANILLSKSFLAKLKTLRIFGSKGYIKRNKGSPSTTDHGRQYATDHGRQYAIAELCFPVAEAEEGEVVLGVGVDPSAWPGLPAQCQRTSSPWSTGLGWSAWSRSP